MKQFPYQGKDDSFFISLINRQIKYIEKQCKNAVYYKYKDSWNSNFLMLENTHLELFNNILDKLKKDNYKLLRKFKGNAKFTTYIDLPFRRPCRVERCGPSAFGTWLFADGRGIQA